MDAMVTTGEATDWECRSVGFVAVIALLATGCQGAEATDAGAAPGTPGANVWFATSDHAKIVNDWYYYNVGTGQSGRGSDCVVVDRRTATQQQLDFLAGLTLVPLTADCTEDGWSATELRVFDVDGGVAIYRDTGCEHLVVPEATAMLPRGIWAHFSTDPACR